MLGVAVENSVKKEEEGKCSAKTCAAGLTLTHANTAVILEPSLTPGIEAQAAGRISRIGQTKAAKVIRLIVADTVEEKILEWQARRMDSGTNKSAQLSLNDFVQLGLSA